MKKTLISHWKSIAVAACAFAFATGLQAQPPTNNLPVVSVLAPDNTALAGTSTGAFTLIRHGSTNDALVVDVAISGSASNGVDYAAITGPITIPAGSLAVDIPVVPIVDTNNYHKKTVTLTVETNGDYVIHKRHATVEIIGDTFNIPPPTIVLTSPTNDSVFMYPASITLAASATDEDAEIQSISFYANDHFLGSTTNNPATLTWTNAHPGHYALFARAVDVANKSAISSPVEICVTNVVPMVAITSPTNGSVFTAGTNITVDATATNADGTITSVTFYANGRTIGSSTTSPYGVTWTNVPMGAFFLDAVATAGNGSRGYAAPVFIRVNPLPPVLSSVKKH